MFIFISDNGLFYGEHRIASGKVLPYEEGLRLPLVIEGPEALPGRGEAGAAGRQAGGQHRPRADHPRPRGRPALLGEREVPDHGRALADAAADAIGPLAARSRPADRVPSRGRRALRDLPVRGDQDQRQHLRRCTRGSSIRRRASASPPTSESDTTSKKDPFELRQPVLRWKRRATARPAPSRPTSRPG